MAKEKPVKKERRKYKSAFVPLVAITAFVWLL
jgi:hypothetical protein